jgi:hypothetical protein
MKKKVNITIKDFDQNQNLTQIRDINIECGAEVIHLEDDQVGVISSIRNNSIVVLWYQRGSEVFSFSELDKLKYTIKNRLPLINITKINLPIFNPIKNIINHNIDREVSNIMNKCKDTQNQLFNSDSSTDMNTEEIANIKNIISEYKNNELKLSPLLSTGLDTLNWTISTNIF